MMTHTTLALVLVLVSYAQALHPSCSDVSLADAFNAGLARVKNSGKWSQIFSIDPQTLLSFDCSSDPTLIPFPARAVPWLPASGKQAGCLRYKSTAPPAPGPAALTDAACNTNCLDSADTSMGMGMGPACSAQCQCLGFTQLDTVLNSGKLRVLDTIPHILGVPDRQGDMLQSIVDEINAYYNTQVTIAEDYGVTATNSPAAFEALVAAKGDVLFPNFSFAGVFRGLQRGYSLVQPTCAALLTPGVLLVPKGTTLADIKNPASGIKMCVAGAGSQAVYQAAFGVPVTLLDPNSFTNDESYNQFYLNNDLGCNAFPDTSLVATLDPTLQDGTDNPASLAAIAATYEDLPAPFMSPVGSFVKC